MDDGDALDVLRHQDDALLVLFAQLDSSTGLAVTDRARYGNQGKRLIRRMAIREAAKADIVHALGTDSKLDGARKRLIGQVTARRTALNVLDKMARGVSGMDLNKGQDFDTSISVLRAIVTPEIDWEIAEGIVMIRSALSEGQLSSLHGPDYLKRHAPTKLDPRGFRRYERARVIAWTLTAWDHLKDRPRPLRGAQVRD